MQRGEAFMTLWLDLAVGQQMAAFVSPRGIQFHDWVGAAEKRFLHAMAPAAVEALEWAPASYHPDFANLKARNALIPDADLIAFDDDQLVADMRMVPVEQVVRAREERSHLHATPGPAGVPRPSRRVMPGMITRRAGHSRLPVLRLSSRRLGDADASGADDESPV